MPAAAEVASPEATLGVDFAPAHRSRRCSTRLTHAIALANTGDVPPDNLVVIDTLPVEMTLLSVRTGSLGARRSSSAGQCFCSR